MKLIRKLANNNIVSLKQKYNWNVLESLLGGCFTMYVTDFMLIMMMMITIMIMMMMITTMIMMIMMMMTMMIMMKMIIKTLYRQGST